MFTGSYLPVLFFVFAAVATGIIVSRGIRKGIERISIILVPLCFIILIALTLYGTTLSGFKEGISYCVQP